MAYAELIGRPIHVLAITSDLTENDLKQRRELLYIDGNLQLSYIHAAPVEAAIHGRILLLDGLEKAARNVLPMLTISMMYVSGLKTEG